MSEPLDAITQSRLAATIAAHARPRAADRPCVMTHEIVIDLPSGVKSIATRLPAAPAPKLRAPRPVTRCQSCRIEIPNPRDYQKYCCRRCYLVSRKPEKKHNGAPPPDSIIIGPVSQIQAIVCSIWKVPLAIMTAPGRAREYAWPRQAAMALCARILPQTSLPQIGRLFGGRDHTTVMHARRAADYRLTSPRKQNKEFTRLYRRAETRCRSLYIRN